MQGSRNVVGNEINCIIHAVIIYWRVSNKPTTGDSKPDKQKLARNQEPAETGYREAIARPDRKRRAQIRVIVCLNIKVFIRNHILRDNSFLRLP